MSGTYADFLKAAVRESIVLVELTPSVTLEGWTAVGPSATLCSQMAFPGFVQSANLPGGVYRRLITVRKDRNSNLTEGASLAAVQAGTAGFYHDRAAGLLYVRTSNTSGTVQAFVRFYVATKGILLDLVDGDPTSGVYYHPWLTGNMPRLSEHAENALYGGKIAESASLELTNGHGFWHAIIANDGIYNWKNKTVKFYFGGSYDGLVLARTDYAEVLSLLVDDIAANESVCTLTLKPATSLLDLDVPPTPFFADDYPNLGEGVEGTRKWIGYGRATIPPDLTDTTSHGVYTICDTDYLDPYAGMPGGSPTGTLYAVHGVNAISKGTGVRTPLTEGVDYSVNLAAGTLTILTATYAWETYTMEVDVTGKKITGGTDPTSPLPALTASRIVLDLLQSVAKVSRSSNDFDMDSFDQAALDAPEEISLWIKEPRSFRSLLSSSDAGFASLERSVMGRVSQDETGRWKFDIWTPGYDPAATVALRKSDFASFEPQPNLESVFTTARVYFNHDYSSGAWPIQEATDDARQILTDSRERYSLYTFLRNSADALRLAQRYRFIASATGLEVEFAETGTKLAGARPWDKVLVTYAPAPAASGAFVDKVFDIIRLDRALGPTFQVSGRIGDMRGVGHLIGHWMDSAAPDWASSTAAERQQSGYWTDSAGLPDPGDASSGGVSLWW